MRKSLAIVLSALLLMTACCFALPVSAAEGTPINTAEEFAAMAADGTYYLNADITLSASYANPFTGTLDGNGKTVTVSAPMFAEFNGTLKNITITGNISSTADTGAVAPLSNSGCVMNNVTNNVNISVITDTAVLVGGLIGNDLGTDIVSDYTGVTNNGDVYVDCETADHRVGGLVGFAHNAIFTRCTNNGDVTVIGADPFVGGLSGYAAGKPAAANTAEAYYCLNTGKITAQSPTNDGGDAGGLYGDIGCSSNLGFFRVFGCVNTGDVYGGYLSAGLVAYAYGSQANEFLDVEFSVNAGNITYGFPVNAETGAERTAFASHFIAYTNSPYTAVKYNVATGTVAVAEGCQWSNNPFIGMSSADALMYDISDNYLLAESMTGFVNTFWNTDTNFAEHPNNRQPLTYGADNGLWTVVTADELASGKIAVELNKAGEGYEGFYFYQTIGTDAAPTPFDTSKWVVDNGGVYANGEKPAETTPAPIETTTPAPVEDETTPAPVEDETTPAEQTPVETTPAPTTPTETTPAPTVDDKPAKSGCGSVVALSVLACMIPAAVVICKKKRD